MVYRKGVTEREHQDGKSSQVMHRPPLNAERFIRKQKGSLSQSHMEQGHLVCFSPFSDVIFPSASLGGAAERWNSHGRGKWNIKGCDCKWNLNLLGSSLAVQWLGLHTFTTMAWSLVGELRSCKPCGMARQKKKKVKPINREFSC